MLMRKKGLITLFALVLSTVLPGAALAGAPTAAFEPGPEPSWWARAWAWVADVAADPGVRWSDRPAGTAADTDDTSQTEGDDDGSPQMDPNG